jgi:hypothetical protein
MEEAIDSIAVEMERVGEGQRFVTKLLAERDREPEPVSPSRQQVSETASRVPERKEES